MIEEEKDEFLLYLYNRLMEEEEEHLYIYDEEIEE